MCSRNSVHIQAPIIQQKSIINELYIQLNVTFGPPKSDIYVNNTILFGEICLNISMEVMVPFISFQGEKYLVLKKKYRQPMQEQVPGTKKGGESIKPLHPNPQNELLVSNPMQNRSQTAKTPQPVMVAWCSGPMITVTDALEPMDIDDVSDF